ncbi:hypothetical protein COCNU_scaffold001220G000010 [Cocos nucifera]|nr:hypothetical protein [Cocos nucifera]
MSKAGQYHGSRTIWQDVIGRHCPIFAVNREVLIPIPKPTGFTGADPYKISFQVGHEKFHVPWLFVINRKSSEVPMIDFHLVVYGDGSFSSGELATEMLTIGNAPLIENVTMGCGMRLRQ